MEDYSTLLVVGGILISLLLICYIVWSYRPPRPDLLDYQYGGTHCDIQWSCPTDQEQYKCHVLPPSIAQRLPIKHYLVQVKQDGRWRTVGTREHGQQQKYRVDSLTIGTKVQFRLVTVNVLGRRSFPSDTSPPYNVVDRPSSPGTPWVEEQDIVLDESGRSCVRTSVGLRWIPPNTSKGSSITKFTICTTEDYCSWGMAGVEPGNKNTCRVENLKPGTTVQFNVIAHNSVGNSKPSDTSAMYHVIDRPRQPKKPWFQEFTTASCTLNWDKPDFDGGAEITKYIIHRRENHGDWKLYTNFTPQVEKPLALKIIGLKVNARVTFRIIAVNMVGESSPSTPSSLYAPVGEDGEEETENLASCSCSPNSVQQEVQDRRLTRASHSTIVETEI